MPTVIKVTEEHISEGVRHDSSHCMIAEAIKQQVPGALRVTVDLATIRYSKDGLRYIHLTPPVCQTALLQFDDGRPPKPYAFRLRGPAQVVQARSRDRRTDKQAELKPGNSQHPVPRKMGGDTPPLGNLAGGDLPTGRNQYRTGRIRRFGLRAMGRGLDIE